MLQKAETAVPGDTMTPEEAIKDPFVLEFLELKDEYSESDLEEALIQHLNYFLLELGDDFAFVGRQRRFRIDDSWFRVDLVFFDRRLKSSLIVDIKIDNALHCISSGLSSQPPSLPRARHSQDGSRTCIDLLPERENTVEDEVARAGRPVHLMRLVFIDSQLKLVPLESSDSRKIFATYSPRLFEINSAFISIQARTRFKKIVRHKHLPRCYPSRASMPGMDSTLQVK